MHRVQIVILNHKISVCSFAVVFFCICLSVFLPKGLCMSLDPTHTFVPETVICVYVLNTF